MTIPEQAVQAAAKCYLNRTVSINETASSLAHAMLTAAFPHLAAVRVKKLEWRQEENGDFIAESVIGWYHIGLPHRMWNLTKPNGEVPSFWTLDEAKASAQADYEARILSALEPSAARELALEEAARVAEERAKLTTGCNPYYVAIGIAEAIRALHPVADKPDEAGAQGEGWLPQDVINLVIAAREFWEDHYSDLPSSHALDEALEAFSSRVLYENEPDALPTPPSGEVA